MIAKSRITSILNTNNLDYSVTGFQPFDLSSLALPTHLDFDLPTNLRLGHLAEKIVGKLIKASTNYKVHYENVQLKEEKRTIGEIDFIIEDLLLKQLFHVELAYKFYLFDPNISDEPIRNWIGPNRNDSLVEKLAKLKSKQFPLLHHPSAQTAFHTIDLDQVSQALCYLVSLFVPYEFKAKLDPIYSNAVKGYYVNRETFKSLHHPAKTYHVPTKTRWGMEPDENETWGTLSEVETALNTSLDAGQAALVWQKMDNTYSALFIVWW